MMRSRFSVGLVAVAIVAGLVAISNAGGTEGDRMSPTGDLAGLTVIDNRPDARGYDRDCGSGGGCVFGPAWKDVDHNGCDTRNDVLRRDLTAVQIKPGTNGCKVTGGRLRDPYSGAHITFSPDDPGAIVIDHIVPLAAAWDYGANDWPNSKRERFANDPANLTATDRAGNASKSDDTPGDQLEPDAWEPTTEAGRCFYGRQYVEVVTSYDLPISRADRNVLQQALTDCEDK